MNVRFQRPAVLLVACLAGWPVPSPAAAAGDPAQGVSVISIAVAADYGRSHTVYAVVQPPGCRTSCAQLLRSRDGGATWTRARAAGWQPGGLAPAPLWDGAALVAWWPDGLGVSLDQGETFRQYATRGAASSVAGTPQGIEAVVGDGTQTRLVSLPGGSARRVQGASDLSQSTVTLTTAYPRPPAGVPAALAVGIDDASGTARLERCDAALACSSPVPVPSGGTIVSSPAFAGDQTFFLLGAQSLLRSTDGGRSLTPITVIPPGPQTLVTTVTALAFTPDFDATSRRGSIYAGVMSASRTQGNGGTLTGGVYRSLDAGSSWTRVGAPGDLAYGASALALAVDGRLFAGAFQIAQGSGGVYCDSGAGWASACPPYRAAVSGGRDGTSMAPTTPAAPSTAAAMVEDGAAAAGLGEPAGGSPAQVRGSAGGAPAFGMALLALGAVLAAGLFRPWRWVRR